MWSSLLKTPLAIKMKDPALVFRDEGDARCQRHNMKVRSDGKKSSSLLAVLVVVPRESRAVLLLWKKLNVAKDQTMLQRNRVRGTERVFFLAESLSVAVVCCAEVLSCPPPWEPLHAAWPTFSLSLSPYFSAALRQMPGWVCERVGMQVRKNLTSWLNVIFTVVKKLMSKLHSHSEIMPMAL